MITSILLFLLGMGLLLISTEKLVKLAENMSLVMKISPLIVGIVLVSIGTSLPELAVSTVSSIRGDVGLAVGNILGSHVINILLVLPVGILFGNLRIGTTKTQWNLWVLVAVTLLFFLTRLLPLPHLLVGILLLGGALGVSYTEYRLALQGREHEDRLLFRRTHKHIPHNYPIMAAVVLLAGIVMGGIFIVLSLENLSELTGISTTVFGLTLIAAITSMPELITTVYSQKNNLDKITVGNIIGSNIYNLLLIGGVVSCFSAKGSISTVTWAWVLATTAGLVVILHAFSGKLIPRWVGVLLLVCFFGYVSMQ
jgi:cation:H+ antiporter